MKDKKIQWHPGFVAAMNLELAGNRDDLIFEKEHNLNTKPLEIDLLIVKKEASVHIVNEIGSFFRGHNIIEYKSPDDHLDIDTFYKVGAYASLYKSYGKTLDERKADDITVSLVREAKPEGLFQYFYGDGYSVSNPEKGIYHVEGKVSIDANQQVMEELKGDVAMCQALLELMEPELRLRDEEKIKEGVQRGLQQGLQKGVQQGLQQGLRQGIQGTVDVLRKYGYGKAEIKKIIMEQYNIPADEAEKYF